MSTADHTSSCEEAGGTKCVCACAGALHRSWLVRVAAVRKNIDNDPPDDDEWETAEYEKQLAKVFGPAYKTLGGYTTPGENVRSGRGWPTKAGIEPSDTAIEKRIVDVTLRDVLLKMFLLPVSVKPHWHGAVKALTLKTTREQWNRFAASLESLDDPNNAGRTLGERNKDEKKIARSGYLWASVIAALCHVMDADPHALNDAYALAWPAPAPDPELEAAQTGTPRGIAREQLATHIAAAANSDEVFATRSYPRATGNPIEYMKIAEAVNIAANALAGAIQTVADLGLSQSDCKLLLQVTGAASSLDLWDHPAAIRYLLLPAIPVLRERLHRDPEHVSDSADPWAFSLDDQDKPVEDLIYEHMVSRWKIKENWGARPDDRADAAAAAARERDRMKNNENAQKRRDQQKFDSVAVNAALTALQDDISTIKTGVADIKRLLEQRSAD
ncbi:hypothetical protein [Mycobacterium sp. NPDC050853]|uniref:hypothetical protein n=1 Tax=Mycobacterium sp. NPDC050853 TaxID=3155160 RepID=UPI0033DA6468